MKHKKGIKRISVSIPIDTMDCINHLKGLNIRFNVSDICNTAILIKCNELITETIKNRIDDTLILMTAIDKHDLLNRLNKLID